MKLLLDTHTFFWLVADEDRLSVAAASALVDPANELYLSSASVWEMAIKASLGKLDLTLPIANFVAKGMGDADVSELPVRAAHALAVAGLPMHHRDPFDRLLVAQARVEGLTLVSADPLVARYGADVIW